MSYRNPKQVLDTSTAKLYSDVSRSISAGMQSIDKAYKADQERIRKNQEEIKLMVGKAQDQKILLDTTLQKAYEGGGTWFDQANKERLSNEANKISLIMQKSIKTPEEMQMISNFMGLGNTTTTDIAQFGALLENMQKDLNRGGKEGGVSEWQDPERLRRAKGFAGLIPGARISVETDISKAGGPINTYKFTDPENGKEYSMTSTELRQMENTPGLGLYSTVPKFTPIIDETIKKAVKAPDLYKQGSLKAVSQRDQFGNLIRTDFVKEADESVFNATAKGVIVPFTGALQPQDYITLYNTFVDKAKENPKLFSNFKDVEYISNESNLEDRSMLVKMMQRQAFIDAGELTKPSGSYGAKEGIYASSSGDKGVGLNRENVNTIAEELIKEHKSSIFNTKNPGGLLLNRRDVDGNLITNVDIVKDEKGVPTGVINYSVDLGTTGESKTRTINTRSNADLAKYIGITLYNDYPGNRREKGDIIPVVKQFLKIPPPKGEELTMSYFGEKGSNVVAIADVETKQKQDQLPTPLERLELNTLVNKYNKYNNMDRDDVRKLGNRQQRERRKMLQAGEPTLQSLRNNKQ